MDHPQDVFTFASLPSVLSLGQRKFLTLRLSFYSTLIKRLACSSALFTPQIDINHTCQGVWNDKCTLLQI